MCVLFAGHVLTTTRAKPLPPPPRLWLAWLSQTWWAATRRSPPCRRSCSYCRNDSASPTSQEWFTALRLTCSRCAHTHARTHTLILSVEPMVGRRGGAYAYDAPMTSQSTDLAHQCVNTWRISCELFIPTHPLCVCVCVCSSWWRTLHTPSNSCSTKLSRTTPTTPPLPSRKSNTECWRSDWCRETLTLLRFRF